MNGKIALFFLRVRNYLLQKCDSPWEKLYCVIRRPPYEHIQPVQGRDADHGISRAYQMVAQKVVPRIWIIYKKNIENNELNEKYRKDDKNRKKDCI